MKASETPPTPSAGPNVPAFRLSVLSHMIAWQLGAAFADLMVGRYSGALILTVGALTSYLYWLAARSPQTDLS